MSGDADIVIRAAEWPRDIAAAHGLLRAYLQFLQNSLTVLDQEHIDSYERELNKLASVWEGNRAALLLAWQGDQAIGCVGVRLLVERAGAAEIKRLWVASEARGSGLGRKLVQAAIHWAKSHGAAELLLDTAPASMPAAQVLYHSMGFMPCERYNRNPVPGIAFYRLLLG